MLHDAATSAQGADIPSVVGPAVSHRSGTWTRVSSSPLYHLLTIHHVLAALYELDALPIRSTGGHFLENLCSCARFTGGMT
jgi:hypothetical protein